MAFSGGDDGEDILTGGATPVASDEGESHHSRGKPRRGDHSLDGSVEYIGTIKKEMRRVLPRLLNLTLLQLLWGNIQDPILGLGPYSSGFSSSSKLEGWSAPGLPPEIGPDGTISFFFQVFYIFH